MAKKETYFFNSPMLLGVAYAAYSRIASEPPTVLLPMAEEFQNVLQALVFASFGLEAFVNEYGELAADPFYHDPRVTPPIKNVAEAYAEAESSRAQLGMKVQAIALALTGRTLPRGAPPYQGFALLLDIRNALAHFKLDLRRTPVEVEGAGKPPPLVERLRATGILATDKNATDVSWTILLGTPAAAKWAYNTATEMARTLIEMVPPSDFRDSLHQYFWRSLARLP